jgi:hypothetical protein
MVPASALRTIGTDTQHDAAGQPQFDTPNRYDLTFVEDNGLGGRRIAGSFDRIAGRLDGLLDFRHAGAGALRLDPVTGAPVGSGDDDARHSTAHRPGGR